MTTEDWLAQQQAARPQDTRLADIRARLADARATLDRLGLPSDAYQGADDTEWLLDQLDTANHQLANWQQIHESAGEIMRRDAIDLTGQLIAMKAGRDAWRAENEGLRDSLGLPQGDGTDYSRHPDQAGLILALEIDRDAWRERAEKAEKTEKRLRQLIDVNNEIMKMGA